MEEKRGLLTIECQGTRVTGMPELAQAPGRQESVGRSVMGLVKALTLPKGALVPTLQADTCLTVPNPMTEHCPGMCVPRGKGMAMESTA